MFLTLLGVGLLGYLVGRCHSADRMHRLCRDQQDRGDYWHNRYREAIQMMPAQGDDE